MSIIEKQTKLGKSIVDINTNVVKSIATQQRENIEKYIETNQEFSKKLPEVTDISSFFSLQREYGETLWNNAKDAVESHNGLVRNAFEETRDAIKVAFSSEEQEVSEEAEVAPKAKAKTKEAA